MSINIFNIHESIMNEYKNYIESFINIKDEEIKKKISSEINDGRY